MLASAGFAQKTRDFALLFECCGLGGGWSCDKNKFILGNLSTKKHNAELELDGVVISMLHQVMKGQQTAQRGSILNP